MILHVGPFQGTNLKFSCGIQGRHSKPFLNPKQGNFVSENDHALHKSSNFKVSNARSRHSYPKQKFRFSHRKRFLFNELSRGNFNLRLGSSREWQFPPPLSLAWKSFVVKTLSPCKRSWIKSTVLDKAVDDSYDSPELWKMFGSERTDSQRALWTGNSLWICTPKRNLEIEMEQKLWIHV